LPNSEKEAKKYLAKFGIPEGLFSKWKFMEISGSLWLVSNELVKNNLFNPQTTGLRLLHITKHSFKPTSYALQFLAPHIKKRIFTVNTDELLSLLNGNSVKKAGPNGYVAVSYSGHIIGCGIIRNNILYSQFPKAIKNALVELLKCNI